MPAPYGTFTKATTNRYQPNTKALNYFALQLVTDAVATSSIPLVSNAKSYFWDSHPNFQELKNTTNNFTTLISLQHDQQTQLLYPNDWKDKSKSVKFWYWAMMVNTTIEASPLNNDLIQDVHDEMVDLLTLNNATYTNSISQGGAGIQYHNITDLNVLVEDTILKEGENIDRPNYLTSSLTIILKVYLGNV